MEIQEVGKNKYAVFNDKGRIVLLTHHKGVAIKVMQHCLENGLDYVDPKQS
jgi:saccharopine dehydrogenase-like NADP-dependent oxidoreductase